MEQTDQQAVIAFDTLYTNNHIQILKILLPLFDHLMPLMDRVSLEFTSSCCGDP